jgi:predicted transcriptional regulator
MPVFDSGEGHDVAEIPFVSGRSAGTPMESTLPHVHKPSLSTPWPPLPNDTAQRRPLCCRQRVTSPSWVRRAREARAQRHRAARFGRGPHRSGGDPGCSCACPLRRVDSISVAHSIGARALGFVREARRLMHIPISSLINGRLGSIARIAPDATVLDAVHEMNSRRIGCVLVMEGEGLTGIFTERDVLTRVVVNATPANQLRVRDVMTPNPVTSGPDATVQEVMDLFSARHIRHLPVVENGKVLAVVSIRDITACLAEVHRAEADQLREYITGVPPSSL